MNYPRFPIFISLAGENVLVIGAGSIASRRVNILLEFGAAVTIVAPGISEVMRGILESITWKKETYSGISLDYTLIVAATNDRQVNNQIGIDAKKLGIPVSVADAKDESTFWFPAIAKSSGIIVGIVSEMGNHKAVKKIAAAVRETISEEGM